MLCWSSSFVLLDHTDHVILPLGRSVRAFVANLPEDIVQVAYRVDGLADERLLQSRDLGNHQLVYLMARIIAARIAVDAVDVVP